ncbi:MAG TPA: WYL domain-containing protein [Chloroflexi bacterium]|nr:WYL domain-containing protein [Chloroflexota bacterium]
MSARSISTTIPPLTDLLAALSYDALRRIGAFLGVGLRGAGRHHKRTWVLAIAAFWEDSARAKTHWEKLSPPARTARTRLLAAPAAPAALFLSEYGGLRALAQLHPPFSGAEQLFLSGLLHAVGGGAPQAAPRLCTPPLNVALQSNPPAAEIGAVAEEGHPPHTPLTVLHDISQALAFLLQHPTLPLQHRRWLPPSALRALNRRLAAPASLAARSTHRQTSTLRTLWFLAVQANLIDGAHVTAAGWAWAALPPDAQLTTLWRAWLGAGGGADARRAYHQPDAGWDDAIRARYTTWLAHCATPFSATDLANALLSDETLPVAFFVAHFQTLTALDHALATLLDEPLMALGLVARHSYHQHRVTATGRWLLAAESPPWLAWKRGAASAARWRHACDDTLCLQVAWDAAPDIQLALAQFSVADADEPEGDGASVHRYCFTPFSIARAVGLGASMAALWQALTALDLPLHGAEALQLRRWWEEAATPIRVTLAPVLRTHSAAQLAHLAQQAAIRPFLAEVLAPTAAIVTGDIAALLARLRAAGLAVVPDAAVDPTPADDNGLLWLAGKLYQHLGRYLPAPAPIDTRLLDRLLTSQPPWQQALLQAQYERLVEHLADLLDNLPFTPPPTPTDPATWQALIHTAIEQKQSLQITYFSAGRNLLTQRRIEPYWLEEHRGVLYVRAYCHSAARVLTFRLDRIQALEAVSRSSD